MVELTGGGTVLITDKRAYNTDVFQNHLLIDSLTKMSIV